MNDASLVGCLLFYLCAFQMNPVCVWLHPIEVCLLLTGVYAGVCVVGPGFTSMSPIL